MKVIKLIFAVITICVAQASGAAQDSTPDPEGLAPGMEDAKDLGSADVLNPYKSHALDKVVELLGALSVDLKKETAEQEKAFQEYTDNYNEDSEQSKKIVKEKGEEIATLQSDLQEAEAFREGKKKELETLNNNMAKGGMELSAGRDHRKKERALFEKNEATFVESLDQLNRAVEVLAKQAPASASAASAASLVSVAQKLKKTLSESSDFSLSKMQEETLNNFVRSAKVMDESHKGDDDDEAPSFIQEDADVQGPYGEFESQKGGLQNTLKELQEKVSQEKDAATKAETDAQKEFKDWETSLVDQLENGKKSKADLESSILQSQQKSSQDEASLMEAQEIHKSESEHLAMITNEYRDNSKAYRTRLRQQEDEMIAVHEAQRIINGLKYKNYMKIHNDVLKEKADSPNAQGFLQIMLAKRRSRVIERLSAPGLSFLAMKATSRHHSGVKEDPFHKVKNMIRGMLDKLQDTQAKEAAHAAWCDKEQAKTAKEQERKTAEVQKTEDRLEAIQAALEETKAEIEENTKDLNDMTASMAKAESLREEEHKRNTFAISQYEDAIVGLHKAVKILKDYYGDQASEEENRSNDQTQRTGLSTGVVGILEVSIDDFEKLHKETKEAEETAAADYKKLANESEVRMAVFKKSIELNNRRKVKLEFDESTMKNDLKSYKKELANIEAYMAELKESCSVQGPTYEERKAKREAELASLKEALDALQSA
jgi:hypothetical protein